MRRSYKQERWRHSDLETVAFKYAGYFAYIVAALKKWRSPRHFCLAKYLLSVHSFEASHSLHCVDQLKLRPISTKHHPFPQALAFYDVL